MSIILKFLVLGTGILISLFIVWKKLREDYSDEKIFSLSLGVVGGSALGYIVASFIEPILPGIKFWGGVAGGGIVGTWFAKKLSIRFYEALEAVIPAVFVYLLLEAFTKISWLQVLRLDSSSFFQFSPLAGILLSLIVFIYVSRNFRRFMWYPSGKLGLASLSSIIVFFLLRVVIANAIPGMLTLPSKIFDTVLGIGSVLAGLFVLYIRSGRELKFSKALRLKGRKR